MRVKSEFSGFVLVAALAAAAFTYVFMTSAALPEVAASHFDIRGEPNALTSRNSYRAFMAMLVLLIPLLIVGLPAFLARRWPRLLNIPHREYWLAPERIDATLSTLRKWTAVVAVATIGLQCFVHRLVLSANAADDPELDQRALLIGLGVFAAFMLASIVVLHRRFRRP
jgi:uncharacterized membrane protein